jgi:hypothetical protein
MLGFYVENGRTGNSRASANSSVKILALSVNIAAKDASEGSAFSTFLTWSARAQE